MEREAKEYAGKLMVSDLCLPRTPATLEELQERCRPLRRVQQKLLPKFSILEISLKPFAFLKDWLEFREYKQEIFSQELETEGNALVVVLACEATELRLLLTFMYTGEVTASKSNLPSLLRLAQTLKVSGLTDSETNPTMTSNATEITPEPGTTCTNLETVKREDHDEVPTTLDFCSDLQDAQQNAKETENVDYSRTDRDRLSKLDQIVHNLYSTHKITSPINTAFTPPLLPSLEDTLEQYDRKWRTGSSVCGVCNKRLSNQYNLRVHMETHAGRRHACRACNHVSRSRDALRKHVAYRHAPGATTRPQRVSRLDS